MIASLFLHRKLIRQIRVLCPLKTCSSRLNVKKVLSHSTEKSDGLCAIKTSLWLKLDHSIGNVTIFARKMAKNSLESNGWQNLFSITVSQDLIIEPKRFMKLYFRNKLDFRVIFCETFGTGTGIGME